MVNLSVFSLRSFDELRSSQDDKSGGDRRRAVGAGCGSAGYGKRWLEVEGERDEAGRRWRNGWRHFGTVYRAIEGVAFDGDAAGGADQAFEFGARCKLRSFCASVVINLFFDHRAVEVVCAEPQRDLRDAGRQHDPIGLDVLEIVEHQA